MDAGDSDIRTIDGPCRALSATPCVPCAPCPHAGLQAAGACRRGHRGVRDAHTRRLDRFFRSHRGLADRDLGHPFIDVDAIVAGRLPVGLLTPRPRDADHQVRLAAQRLIPSKVLAHGRHRP